MYQNAPITERVQRIREKYRSTKPQIDLARYKLVTEFYMENPDLTGILKRAYNLRNLFEKMPTPVREDEKIVGFAADSYRGCALFPENSFWWFLDEIDNLTLSMQAMILRFLQEKEIYHVGGDFAIPVNTRVIAATNKDPLEMVQNGEMRKDLYYRLNVIEIRVPPLRERIEDIPEIAASMAKQLSSVPDRGMKIIEELDPQVYEMLMKHDWPGNIRELSNVIECAVNRCYERRLKPEHFVDFQRRMAGNETSAAVVPVLGKSLHEIKRDAEKHAIEAALSRSGGNITKAAEELGVSRQMLHRKLKEIKEDRETISEENPPK